jgi:hypothetical protein
MTRSILIALISFVVSANLAYGACGGGGWKKHAAESDSYTPPSKNDSTQTSSSSTTKATETTKVSTRSSPYTSPNVPVKSSGATLSSTVSSIQITPLPPQGKLLDTAQYDAISAKLGLTIAQRNEVDRAKSEILGEVARLRGEKLAAEKKYAICDGDCSSEYNKLNKAAVDLKNYVPEREFERRLAAILQPNQLQTYRSDAKKIDEPQPKKS